jgi:site-specific DNA recombinase
VITAVDGDPAFVVQSRVDVIGDAITSARRPRPGVVTSCTHNQTKALADALVAEVTITGPDRLIPVFRIPQADKNNGATPALPADTAPKEWFA